MNSIFLADIASFNHKVNNTKEILCFHVINHKFNIKFFRNLDIVYNDLRHKKYYMCNLRIFSSRKKINYPLMHAILSTLFSRPQMPEEVSISAKVTRLIRSQ